MRLKRAASIAALIMTMVLASAGKCEEVGPDVVPGEEPGDKVTIVQLWTYEPEPIKIRLTVHNGEGIPLLSNKGEPLDNYVTTVATGFDAVAPGHAAIWEMDLYHPGSVSGSLKADLYKGVKGGCRFFSRDKAGKRTSLGQDQTGQGPRFTCLFSRS
jgi:hypothetical protein